MTSLEAGMDRFIADLNQVFLQVERGHHAFVDAAGIYLGFVQLILYPDHRVTLHRLWTLASGKGYGSIMLRALCDVADRHGVEITLKVIPIGRKPYPLTREQLLTWYQRHGFEGTRRKMIRKPRAFLRKEPAGMS
jgi:GNAT superfamily N-acetyltransferase